MTSEAFNKVFAMVKKIQYIGDPRPVEDIRKGLENVAKMTQLAEDVKIEQINADGVKSVWITNSNSNDTPVILYIHGGGYVSGAPNTHYTLTSRVARVTKGRVLSIDYRLAPEHPFPEGLEDAIKAYKYLLNTKRINPSNIVLAGDSAGGGLALATALKLKMSGIPMPRAIICFSPWLDLALLGDSFKNNAEKDPFLTPQFLKVASKWYCADTDPKHPLVSPLYADLQGLPPILLQVGTEELLLDDSIRFSERAKEAGVDMTIEVNEGMIHVFQAFADFAPEPQEALERVGKYVQKLVN